MSLEEITKEAVQLPRRQRLALAGLLLELDDYSDDPQIEAAWEQEILERIQAVDNGTSVGVSLEDAMSEAENRLTP